MISSMTAYARASQEGDFGSITWELRAVNHRYLDLTLKLPETQRPLEPKIREQVQAVCKRGKFEALLKYAPGKNAPVSLKLNETLLADLSQACKTVHAQLFNVNVEASQLLSWPGMMQTAVADTTELDLAILALLNESLKKFVAARQREGEGLKQFLLERCAAITEETATIEADIAEILNAQKQKLLTRAKELEINLDTDRLEQEVLLWAQRADVAEELQRLRSHIAEVLRILEKGGVIGRRLDFLMQELNREANTLSSKSSGANITKAAVEIKVLIEQMREQVQNIE